MNDRAVAVFDQYDLELFGTKKGRGMLIARTQAGEVDLREYGGSEEKLEWQEAFTGGLKQNGFPNVDGLFRDKEGNLIVSDYEGTRYIVKEYFGGRECNVMDRKECVLAVRQMARMHRAIRDMMQKPLMIRHRIEPEENGQTKPQEDALSAKPVYREIPADQVETLCDITCRTRPGFILYESKKRKAELLRARQFIRKKPCKNDFDLLFLKEFDRFAEQIAAADSYLDKEEYGLLEEHVRKDHLYCHGDCNQHNILFGEDAVYIQNFEKCRPDLQVKDLYLFVRKVCEKNKWSFAFGQACLDAYEKELPLTEKERRFLYTRFYYPEKFWKIANGYMNRRKSLPPKRQKQKLEALLEMERGREEFLRQFRETYRV